MGWKWLAVGNPMMGDDAIALTVTQHLQKQLEEAGFEVVIGESDIDYMLDCLEDGDRIIICDATALGGEPGNIRMLPLTQAMENYAAGDSLHRLNLLRLLPLYLHQVKGYFIGIEVTRIDLGVELSADIQNQFERICSDIFHCALQHRE